MLKRNQLPAEVVEAVSGSIIAPVTSLTGPQRITIFARLAAPSLLRASRGAKSNKLASELLGIVTRLDIAGLGEMDMRRICADALTVNGHPVPPGFAPPRDPGAGESVRPERYSGGSTMPPSLAPAGSPDAPGASAPAVRKGWFARFLDWLLRRG